MKNFDANIIQILDHLYRKDTAERESNLSENLRMHALNRDSARFLHLICRASHAKNILEIGTSHGISTIWLAWAVLGNGGKVTTVEIDAKRAEAAKENFRKTGLSYLIDLVVADAKQFVPTLKNSFDLVFLDTVKADYPYYLKTVFPLLPPGGIVVADNAISHADQLKDYFKILKSLGFQTVTVPIGAGIEFSVKSEA